MAFYGKIIKQVGGKFWRHIHKETLIPYKGNMPSREKFLKDLSEKIEKMQYIPSPPRAYIVSHKQNLVVRFIPTMQRSDYCIYFFCVKSLEKEIAKNRVRGTYGGWKLGGKIRRAENGDDAPSTPDASYNRFEWMRAWTDYQKRAYGFYLNDKFKYFIVFDIANFYDSVRLGRLEILLREAAQKNKTSVVNLLIYFLSNWGKRDLNYERQSTGLPQDEVGDCSRILANFYLQDYDKKIYKIVSRKKGGYLRYADDQIIAAPNEKTAKKIMFLASQELAKIGLNLNASKAKFFENRDEFSYFWSFDIFKLLGNKNNKKTIESAYSLFKARKAKDIQFKSDAVLKRLLSCNLRCISRNVREEILEMVNRKEFLINVKDYYLKRIYEFMPRNKKSIFLKYLNNLSDEILFNEFHLRVMKFFREKRIDGIYSDKLHSNLLKLNDLV